MNEHVFCERPQAGPFCVQEKWLFRTIFITSPTGHQWAGHGSDNLKVESSASVEAIMCWCVQWNVAVLPKTSF